MEKPREREFAAVEALEKEAENRLRAAGIKASVEMRFDYNHPEIQSRVFFIRVTPANKADIAASKQVIGSVWRDTQNNIVEIRYPDHARP